MVSVLISGAVFVSSRVQTPPLLHSIALFGHLASLVVGFGSVVGVDYFGLLWFLRRIPLETMLLQADRMSPLIWLGLGGPDFDRLLDGTAARSTVDFDQDGLCRRSRDSRRPGLVDQANDDAADADSQRLGADARAPTRRDVSSVVVVRRADRLFEYALNVLIRWCPGTRRCSRCQAPPLSCHHARYHQPHPENSGD